MPATESLDWCAHTLGYRFADGALLAQALTHGSSGRRPTYERLEFLGDRVLGLVVADMLLEAFPDVSEGELGRRHAALVQGSLLVDIAHEWALLPHIVMGAGEQEATVSVVSDVVEALLGAVYVDGGFAAAGQLVRTVWAPRLALHDGYDAKTRVQEWLQARKLKPPQYEVVACDGPEHARHFTVEARCAAGSGRGTGPSKQAAGMAAAAALWQVLQGEEQHG